MKRIHLDHEWQFAWGEPSSIPGMGKPSKTIDLPHDFMIGTDSRADSVNGANTGFYSGATATYTKWLDIPQEWNGQRVLVEFDGVSRDTTVLLNGSVIGRHHYGYTPFRIDLTAHLKFGEKNRLAVIASNDAEPNSRWYPGGGIYRHVNLLVSPMVHIAPDGLFAHTSHLIQKDAFVIVEAEVENHLPQPQSVWVNFNLKEKKTGSVAASGRIKAWLPPHETAIARTQLTVENAKLWDVDDPALYTIEAQLENADGPLDTAETCFGIRTISMDAKNGFQLNGRSLKLKGGCIHHDNGILGAASFYESEYRKVLIHKKNGYNALRFAHNPMSTDLLRACDELGILVYDEAFDTWNVSKNRHDFTLHFAQEWKEELTAFIKRDRNHPSVIIWSIGNELPEQGGLSDGYRTSAMLAAHVRSLDPTRFVAGALCSFFNGLDDADCAKFWQSLMQEKQLGNGALNNLDSSFGRSIWNDYTEAFVAPWDVVGYNYLNYHYAEAGELFPNRVICATESKPGQMEEYWVDVQKYPYLIGDFLWTSHDYIGEAGIGTTLYVEPDEVAAAAQKLHYAGYPWRTAGTGDFDLCGFETMQCAYHRIIWGSKETFIACHNPANFHKVELLGRYGWPDCAHSWTWPVENGSDIKVEIYSGAPEVALYLNGEIIGTAKTEHKKAMFTLNYQPGTLEAVSLVDGVEVSRDCLKTAEKPCKVRITPDENGLSKTVLSADGQSLCFAVVEVTDAEGNPIPYDARKAIAQVEGAASLAAFGSARPETEENYTAGRTAFYHGKLLAIIRSGYEAGEAVLTIRAEGLPEATLSLTIKKDPCN